MNFKTLLPTIIAAVSAAIIAVAPQIQHVLSLHPEAATIVAAIYAILSHFAPSPVQGGKN